MNELLRHSIATIAYRFDKVVKEQDASFGDFSLGDGTRTSNQIINHMFDVLHATRIFIEEERFSKDRPEGLSFTKEVERFKAECVVIDHALLKSELPIPYAKRLIQGPVSDIFTHIGQLSMMSRLNGKPIAGEDFSAADIQSSS